MRPGFNDRFIVVLVAVALVVAPLPAFSQEERRAPQSGALHRLTAPGHRVWSGYNLPT